MANVNWHNVFERCVSTATQALVGVLGAGAEYIAAHGVADWRTGLTAVGIPALLSLAKNLQAELQKDVVDPITTNVAQLPDVLK